VFTVTTFYVGSEQPVHYGFSMYVVHGKYADLKEILFTHRRWSYYSVSSSIHISNRAELLDRGEFSCFWRPFNSTLSAK
jgi:hypothetical protein